jgi:preprotein translocase subunit SecD
MRTGPSLCVALACAICASCGGSSAGTSPHTHRGVALTYQVTPVTRAQINPQVLDRAAQVMRERLAALGVKQATVTRAGDTFRVTVPAASKKA